MFLFLFDKILVKCRSTFLATAGVAVHLMWPPAPKGSLELPGPSGRNTSDWLAVNMIDQRFLQSSSVTFSMGSVPNGYVEKRNPTDFFGGNILSGASA